jgi:multidrug resistance efflux pump
LEEVRVEPFQPVEAGQPLLVFRPVEPRAELSALQSELQVARLRLEPSLADRNALNYEQVRLELLRQRQELALAGVNLERAESALRRNEALRRDRLISEDIYELSLRDRDLFQAQQVEIARSIAEIERRLAELSALGEPQSPGTNSAAMELVAGLEARLARVQSGWEPVTLLAPISGMVHTVYRQGGEAVVEGEPLVTIHSPQADRIVAYLRQPYRFKPEPGHPVEVVTRNPPRQRFHTEILQVGAQLEPITNALAILQAGKLVDAGLQIVLPVPPDLVIRPGEIVDVRVGSSSLDSLFNQPAELAFDPASRVP